jgi:hypothetical protein
MMAAACVVVVCVVVTTVLFTKILPLPAFVPSSFMGNLPWLGVGAAAFVLVGFVVWLVELWLRTWRDIRRWLDSLGS